jgi:hypothetical protein
MTFDKREYQREWTRKKRETLPDMLPWLDAELKKRGLIVETPPAPVPKRTCSTRSLEMIADRSNVLPVKCPTGARTPGCGWLSRTEREANLESMADRILARAKTHS